MPLAEVEEGQGEVLRVRVMFQVRLVLPARHLSCAAWVRGLVNRSLSLLMFCLSIWPCLQPSRLLVLCCLVLFFLVCLVLHKNER